MFRQKKLLVVTDLDASLLDHDYSWEAAKPALAKLKSMGVPLVLNSSKTVYEMKDLAAEIGTFAPVVAENGGILAVPEGMGLLQDDNRSRTGDYVIEVNGLSRDFILSVAHELRELEVFSFSGFADWSVGQVADRTGLSLSKAQRAKQRFATEPILWEGTVSRRREFEEALIAKGIRVLKGGRFFHLMGNADKADGTAAALKLYQKAQPDVEWVVVALGDSANDLAMLEAADIAVVLPHADGPHINPKAPRVVHAPFTASKGWSTALLSILDEFC
ncbi:MAG: HAD-IIB family hydrolase [Lentimonas sp.]